MANSISVAVGDIDTIRVGRWSRVSLPAGVSRVTGNAAPWPAGAAASDLAPSWPQPAATRATASSRARDRRDLLIHPPLGRRMRGSWGSEAQPALPPRTELAATEAGDLARPRRSGGASQLRDSAGFAPDFAGPRGARRRRRARRVYDTLRTCQVRQDGRSTTFWTRCWTRSQPRAGTWGCARTRGGSTTSPPPGWPGEPPSAAATWPSWPAWPPPASRRRP